MFEQYADQLHREALATYPEEAVWLITSGECHQVENVAADPRVTFRVAKQDLAAAYSQGLLAVVHSHPDFPACPSASDMQGQLEMGVPWGIVATDGETVEPVVWWGDDVAIPALIGRGFRHGVTDCYSIIRDYYRLECGITLPEYPRSWEWWHSGDDLYRTGFSAAGFHHIAPEDTQPGDVWLAQLRSPVTNHGGIILEGGLALHHPSARRPVDAHHLSRREPLARWQHHITHWLRHESR